MRAHAKVGCQDYNGALLDANKVFYSNIVYQKFESPVVFIQVLINLREPDNPGALIARGDAFYFLGKFEHALVR